MQTAFLFQCPEPFAQGVDLANPLGPFVFGSGAAPAGVIIDQATGIPVQELGEMIQNMAQVFADGTGKHGVRRVGVGGVRQAANQRPDGHQNIDIVIDKLQVVQRVLRFCPRAIPGRHGLLRVQRVIPFCLAGVA